MNKTIDEIDKGGFLCHLWLCKLGILLDSNCERYYIYWLFTSTTIHLQ